MDPMPIPTTLNAILLLIKAKLVADEVAGEDQIDFTLSRSPKTLPHLWSDRDIWLWPRGERAVEGFFEGSGRADCRVIRTLNIVVRTRLNLDHAESDRLLLTEATEGHGAIEDKIINSIHDYLVHDEDNNTLTFHGIEFKQIEGPERVEERGEERGWAASTIVVEIPYRRVLNGLLNPIVNE